MILGVFANHQHPILPFGGGIEWSLLEAMSGEPSMARRSYGLKILWQDEGEGIVAWLISKLGSFQTDASRWNA
jgi:hypothetical protein